METKPTQTISAADIKRRRAAGELLSTAQKRYLRCLERGDRDECAYCGVRLHDRNRTIDHRQSLIRGGGNDLSNICLACHDCNERKSAMSVDEYLAFLALTKSNTYLKVSKPPVRKDRHTVPITALMSDESRQALASLVTSDS